MTETTLFLAFGLLTTTILMVILLLTYLWMKYNTWKFVACIVIYAYLFVTLVYFGIAFNKWSGVYIHPFIWMVFIWMYFRWFHVNFMKPRLEDEIDEPE